MPTSQGVSEQTFKGQDCGHSMGGDSPQRPGSLFAPATHGQRLQRLGNHDGDFRCCAAVNSLTVAPTRVRPGFCGGVI